MLALDIYFFTVLNKDLEYTSHSFLEHQFKFGLNPDVAGDILVTIDGVIFNRAMLHHFKPNTRLNESIVTVFLAMLKRRDDRICRSHLEINAELDAYVEHKLSLFFMSDVLDSICNQQFDRVAGVDFEKVHRVYFCVAFPNDKWAVVLLDCSAKQICYVCPNIDSPFNIERLQAYEEGLRSFTAVKFGADNAMWPCVPCPDSYLEPIENDFDGGIYAMILLYTLAHGSPIVIKTDYLERYRRNIAYWILSEQLPI
jgi:hypothetical protein